MTNNVFFSKILFPAVKNVEKCYHMLLTYHFALLQLTYVRPPDIRCVHLQLLHCYYPAIEKLF